MKVAQKDVRKEVEKMSGISIMLLIVFALFVLQAIGGVFQILNYKKAIRRVHKFGNVGFGQKRGGLSAGYIVMIACDQNGTITGGEIMKGFSFLARFKPWKSFLGRDVMGESIYSYLDELHQMDKKKRKRYKGYINALEALDQRLNRKEEEQDTGEETKLLGTTGRAV